MTLQVAAAGRPGRLTAVLVAGLAGGCAGSGGPGAVGGSGPVRVFEPAGEYDVTMSSERMVSEGTMDIRGEPGGYAGVITVGGVTARIVSVEAGADHMTVHAIAAQGNLILRLVWDGESLSGNWILGAQRGTFAGRKRRDQQSGGPVSIGTSGRPPHSDHDPS